MTNKQEPKNVTPTSAVISLTPGMKEAVRKRLEEFIKEETKLVKGVFHNYETPGAAAPITVEKYPGVPKFKMSMVDGMSYEVPLYVARFLNGIDVTAGAMADHKDPDLQNIGTCSYPTHGFKMSGPDDLKPSTEGYVPGVGGGIAVPIVAVTGRTRRYGFSSMEVFG